MKLKKMKVRGPVEYQGKKVDNSRLIDNKKYIRKEEQPQDHLGAHNPGELSKLLKEYANKDDINKGIY